MGRKRKNRNGDSFVETDIKPTRERKVLKYTLVDFHASYAKKELKHPKLGRTKFCQAFYKVMEKLWPKVIEDNYVLWFPHIGKAMYVRENPEAEYEPGREGAKYRITWQREEVYRNRLKYKFRPIRGTEESGCGIRALKKHVNETYFDKSKNNYRGKIAL